MGSARLNSSHVKAQAARLGFVGCGLARAEPVEAGHAARLRRWLQQGYQAGMDYMQRNVELRLDPRLLVPGAQTVVSLAMNFLPARQQPAISLYAQGRDYHDVVRDRMRRLMEAVGMEGRCFVDTAPVLERYWAWRSGVGVFTTGGLIAVPGHGPTVFLSELILTQEADRYDQPLDESPHTLDHNTSDPTSLPLPKEGSFSCLQPACSPPPRGRQEGGYSPSPCPALTPDGLDARLCASYLTIEHRGPLPDGLRLGRTFYGCDRCLRTSPLFREARPTDLPDFQPSEALLRMQPDDWRQLTEDQYRQLFRGSAVKRAKYSGVMRNIARWLREDCSE